MIRQELRRWSSQWYNGALMYPGVYVLTWFRAPFGWTLVDVSPYEEPKK